MAAKSGFRFSPMLQSIAVRLACGLLAIPLLTGIGGIAHGAPAADDWFTMNKDYSAQRYVDLDQITPQNVAGLREVCEVELNQPVFFTSGLIMVGGTLFVATNRQTVALDAATCALRWRHVLDFRQAPFGSNTRGLGYMEGKVFRARRTGTSSRLTPRAARCCGTCRRRIRSRGKASPRRRSPGRERSSSASPSAKRA
jgi:hypothetical protein